MSDWIRVTRAEPCKVCKKPDWCCWHPKIGICCMRVTSPKELRNGGYLHPHDSKVVYVPKPKQSAPEIDCERLMRGWWDKTTMDDIEFLSNNLGVSWMSLKDLGFGWSDDYAAWAVPMFSGVGKMVGIRLRYAGGRKLSVVGGHEGLFIPQCTPQRTCYFPEGPTSLAACLTLGRYGIGRPNCRGGIAHLQVAINRLGIQRGIIFADNDTPKWEGEKSAGVEGARRLSEELQIPVRSMLLPTKDLRKFLQCGGTSEVLESLERRLVWRQPK